MDTNNNRRKRKRSPPAEGARRSGRTSNAKRRRIAVSASSPVSTPLGSVAGQLLEATSVEITRKSAVLVNLICRDQKQTWREIVLYVASLCYSEVEEGIGAILRRKRRRSSSPTAVITDIVKFLANIGRKDRAGDDVVVTPGYFSDHGTNPTLATAADRKKHPFVVFLTRAVRNHCEKLFGGKRGQNNGRVFDKLASLLAALGGLGQDPPKACSVVLGAGIAEILATKMKSCAKSYHATRNEIEGRTRAQLNAARQKKARQQSRMFENMADTLDVFTSKLLTREVNNYWDDSIQLWTLEALESCLQLQFSLVASEALIVKLAFAASKSPSKENGLKAAAMLESIVEKLSSAERKNFLEEESCDDIRLAFHAACSRIRDDGKEVVLVFLRVLRNICDCFSAIHVEKITQTVGYGLAQASDNELRKAFGEFLVDFRNFNGVDDEAFPDFVVGVFSDLRVQDPKLDEWNMLCTFGHALIVAGEDRRMLDWRNIFTRMMSEREGGRLSNAKGVDFANLFKVSAFFAAGGQLIEGSEVEGGDGRTGDMEADVQLQLPARRRALLKFMAFTVCPHLLELTRNSAAGGDADAVRKIVSRFESVLAFDGLLNHSDWDPDDEESVECCEESAKILCDLLEYAVTQSVRTNADTFGHNSKTLASFFRIMAHEGRIGVPDEIRESLFKKLVELMKDFRGESPEWKGSAEALIATYWEGS